MNEMKEPSISELRQTNLAILSPQKMSTLYFS